MMRQPASRYGHANQAAEPRDVQALHRVGKRFRGERTAVIDKSEAEQDKFTPLSQKRLRKLVEALAEPDGEVGRA